MIAMERGLARGRTKAYLFIIQNTLFYFHIFS